MRHRESAGQDGRRRSLRSDANDDVCPRQRRHRRHVMPPSHYNIVPKRPQIARLWSPCLAATHSARASGNRKLAWVHHNAALLRNGRPPPRVTFPRPVCPPRRYAVAREATPARARTRLWPGRPPGRSASTRRSPPARPFTTSATIRKTSAYSSMPLLRTARVAPAHPLGQSMHIAETSQCPARLRPSAQPTARLEQGRAACLSPRTARGNQTRAYPAVAPCRYASNGPIAAQSAATRATKSPASTSASPNAALTMKCLRRSRSIAG
jgi:hypothetical protein